MPKVTREELPISASAPGFEGRWHQFGDMTVQFQSMQQPMDMSEMMRTLPDGRCQCPHWGFVFKGKMVVRYADREETISAGEAFYLPPGHVPEILEPTELIEFSPNGELKKTADALMAAMGQAS